MCLGGLQRKVFPLGDSSAHRTQGVKLRAALKAGKGRRSLLASAKAFEACHPHPGNCKHWLLATASHSTELHAPCSKLIGSSVCSFMDSEAGVTLLQRAQNPLGTRGILRCRTGTCMPVKWSSACSCAATGSRTASSPKNVSTRAVTRRLLVTSNKACIFLSSGSIQDPQA